MRRKMRSHRGMTFIEVLVAALVLGTTLAVITSLWYFSYSMSANVNDVAIAYNIARKTSEKAHESGFFNTAEATSAAPVVHYYDAALVNQDNNTAVARYKMTETVVSSSTVSGANPVQPSNGALRTVTISVQVIPTGKTVYTTWFYLVRGGI